MRAVSWIIFTVSLGLAAASPLVGHLSENANNFKSQDSSISEIESESESESESERGHRVKKSPAFGGIQSSAPQYYYGGPSSSSLSSPMGYSAGYGYGYQPISQSQYYVAAGNNNPLPASAPDMYQQQQQSSGLLVGQNPLWHRQYANNPPAMQYEPTMTTGVQQRTIHITGPSHYQVSAAAPHQYVQSPEISLMQTAAAAAAPVPQYYHQVMPGSQPMHYPIPVSSYSHHQVSSQPSAQLAAEYDVEPSQQYESHLGYGHVHADGVHVGTRPISSQIQTTYPLTGQKNKEVQLRYNPNAGQATQSVRNGGPLANQKTLISYQRRLNRRSMQESEADNDKIDEYVDSYGHTELFY